MKFIAFSIIIFFLSSCGSKSNSEMDENRLESLQRIRIKDNSSVLYAYSYAGLMAWSSSITGRVLIDSTDAFSWNKIKNKFPSGYITNIDSKSNLIDIIRFINDDSGVIGDGMYVEKFGDFTIHVKQYFNPEGSTMRFSYHFDNLSETEDSIYFDKIYRKKYDFGLDFKGKVGFRKGNIVVVEDSLGFVSKIRLNLINQNQFWEDLRKNDSITIPEFFNGINEIDLPPLSKVYMFSLKLQPDSLSCKQRISDFGVYKNMKK